MIKSIELNNCSPYQHAEISDCTKINFIYGSNGSGKSTISSFLSGEKPSRFASSSIVWEGATQETIYVYNRHFRSMNFQQTIPGVFTMGSATIEEINALELMKKELERIRGEWRSRNDQYTKVVQVEIPAREAQFKEDAWNLMLKLNENNYQKAFEGLRANKEKFVSALKKRIIDQKGKVCSREDLDTRAKALYSGETDKCEAFSLNVKQWLDKIEEIRNDPIWNSVIVGNEDIDIGALIKELDNSSWVDQGRKYLRPESKKCPFCQQETITQDFRDKIEAFFDKEYNERLDKIKMLCKGYYDTANSVLSALDDAVHGEKAINIGKLDITVYRAKIEILKSMVSDNVRLMEEKLKEPSRKISLPDVIESVQELLDLIGDANKRIAEHNRLVEKRNDEEENLTNDVWATIISENDALIKKYQKDIDGLQKKENSFKRTLKAQSDLIDKLATDIIERGKNITSVQPTIDEINRSLKSYGFTGFSIQPADGKKNYYCIKREDGSLATDTLSEGEETFLTFLYFMQWTKGSTDPEHISDKKIIVLDDPISSLDSTVLYIVGAMVKELWRKIKAGEGDVNQLFVLTHNTFFHKEASFDPRQSLGNNINFWIIRKDNDVSTIYNYGHSNPISTSYELLWKEIRENQSITTISLQNTMRRIIENYFGILGNRKDEEILDKLETAEERMIARSLLNWINDGSHSIPDDLHIDAYTDAVPKYKNVFREIFHACGHDAHYNMMMGIKKADEDCTNQEASMDSE